MEYDLKWESYHSWTSECIRNLSKDVRFADVTLLTEDLKPFKAHKVILSASSPFFKDILETTSASVENYLFLKGVEASLLKPLLKFIYEGEVSVDQEHLSKFLEAGFEMKITGVMSGNESVMRKRPETQTLDESVLEPDVEIKEVFPVNSEVNGKSEPKSEDEIEIEEEISKELDDELTMLESTVNNNSDYDDDIEEEEEEDDPLKKEAEDGEMSIKKQPRKRKKGRTVPCEVENCEKMFTKKAIMRSHMKTVHSNQVKIKQKPCPDCPKLFYTQAEVTVHHRRKHAGTLEKTHPCPDCDKKFYQTSDVKQHVKSVHLKIKDQACQHCDMMFSTKSNLKTHIKKTHSSD